MGLRHLCCRIQVFVSVQSAPLRAACPEPAEGPLFAVGARPSWPQRGEAGWKPALQRRLPVAHLHPGCHRLTRPRCSCSPAALG